jgi:glycosyltransferase involved in cell wall biosynthesis
MVPSRPVRVAFLIDKLDRAGTESQLVTLLRSFDRSRVEPYLCLLNGEDPESQALEPADVPVMRLGIRSFHHLSIVPKTARFVRYLRDHRIDVVQAYFLDSVYFGALAARIGGVRRVIRVRNNLGYWLTPLHKVLGWVYGRLVDVTLTNSEPGKRAIIESERVRPDKVTVLPNGVAIERFTQAPPPDTTRPIVRVGAVANLRPVKGIDLLIQAAVQLLPRYPQLRFEIAGEGSQRPELDRLIVEHGLGDRFILRGAVADIPAFLASLDVAVLPSRSEGMSNALLEYMASGRAIVATRVGANGDLIRDGVEGLLIDPENAIQLASAIERLVVAPIEACRFGEAARARAVDSFSRDAVRRRFEEFYRGLRG